jgi:hypothetical protein
MTQNLYISPKKAIKLDIFSELESLKNSMGLSKHRFYKNHPFKPSKIEVTEQEAWYQFNNKLEHIYQKKAIIRGTKIVSYIKPLQSLARKGTSIKSIENLAISKSNGYISKATKSKVSKMLETWYQCIEERRARKKHRFDKIGYYITFLTLTLAELQEHDDNTIKRQILDPYIQYLIRVHGVKNYYWKAEPQKNGNIHFHLLIDKFINKSEINNSWNVAQNKLGYVDKYYTKTGDINPPSTKIESIRDKKNGIGYLLKYSTKSAKICEKGEIFKGVKIRKKAMYDYVENDDHSIIVFESRAIQGRVWGCSDILRSLEPLQMQLSYTLENILKEATDKGFLKLFEQDYIQVWTGKIQNLLKNNYKQLFWRFKDYHFKLFNIIYKERQEQIFNKWDDLRAWWEEIHAIPIQKPSLIQCSIEW